MFMARLKFNDKPFPSAGRGARRSSVAGTERPSAAEDSGGGDRLGPTQEWNQIYHLKAASLPRQSAGTRVGVERC